MKPIRFLFPVLLALPQISHAANITWQTPQALASALDVYNQGTLVTSKSTGYGYTVNGVFFNPAATNFSESFGNGGGGFMGGISYIGSNDANGQAYAGLMNIAHGNSDWGAATATITFSNLTVGQEYLVQYWVADYRGYPNDRYVTLTGGANISGQLKYLDSDNSNGGIHGSYVIGTFTADATSQSIFINANESTQMQAVQLRTGFAFTDANGIWTGGDGNWSDATKWDTNTIAQGLDKSATFNGLAPVTATVDTGRPIGALLFSGANHTIAAGAGNLTLDSDTIFTTPTVTVANGITATIGALLAGSEGMTKTGAGTLVLSGSRTYSGTTDITEGTVRYQGGAYATSFHSIASGAVLDFNVPTGSYDGAATTFGGAGTLRKTGAGEVVWGPSAATFALDPGALIDIQEGIFTGGSYGNESWSGNYSDLNVAAGATFAGVEANVRVNKITGSGTITTGYPVGYTGFTIGVDDGSSTFDGVIADSIYSAGKLIKVGTGTITLTGANTYSGTTTVESGTLSLTQAFLNNDAGVVIGFDGKLNLGFVGTDVVGSIKIAGTELTPGVYNSSHPTYGSYFTGSGSLEILGGSGTWTSLVNGNWSVAANWSGNNVVSGLDSIATFNAATGVTVNLDSNRTVGGLTFDTSGYALAGSSTLTLNSSSDISTLTVGPGLSATISAKLATADELKKSGTGTLTLSAQNNFSGAINISQGTLELATDWTLGNVGTGTPIVPGLVTVESGATLRALYSANQLNGLNLNNGTVEAVGGGNADWGNFHLTGNVTATGTCNLNADVALRAANVDFFVDSGATLNVGGVMHNGAYYGIYSGAPANISKSGSGTLTLAGLNTFTGNTSIDDGPLAVSATGGLRFRPTTNTVTNAVSAGSTTATLSFTGTVDLDMSAADATIGNSWTLINLASFTGTQTLTPTAVTSTLGTFTQTAPGSGIWELPVTGAKWVFDKSTGTLTYAAASTPYQMWGSAYGLDTGSEGGDLDNDGLTNFQEFAFGLIPNSGSSVNPITSQLNSTTGQFTYQRLTASGLTYTIWTSPDLVTWTQDATAGQVATPVGSNESVVVTLTGPLPASKLFVRVKAQ